MADVKICDRCGKKLSEKHSILNIKPVRYIFGVAVFKDTCFGKRVIENNSFDFCENCTKDFVGFLEREGTDA